MKKNKLPIILIGIGFLLIAITVILSTGYSLEDLFSSSSARLVMTSQPVCGTVMVLYEESPQPVFGVTNIPIVVKDIWYGGFVNAWGFTDLLDGEVGEVLIGGKAVTLASHTLSSQGINTVEFGYLRILLQGYTCAILLVTPEQYDKIQEWLR